jgi:hypothetical protein
MDVKYIDDSVISKCVKGEKVIEKFIAFSKGGTSLKRYFGMPLSYAERRTNVDFENSIKIQGSHVDVHYNKPIVEKSFSVGFGNSGGNSFHFPIPVVIYKTDKHIIIAPNKDQFNMSKIIFGIATVVLFFILFLLLIAALIFSPVIFIAFAIFFLPVLIYYYLFFVKKNYLSVGPIESLSNINESTIRIKGRFNTGIPSFVTKDYDAEFYVGKK